MRLGIVTCGKCPELTRSERPLLDHLPSAKPVVWNDPTVDWRAYDALLVRSIWDYHLHADLFLQWLQLLENLNLPVWNPISVLRWNHHKFYLRELEKRGVVIAPTQFFRSGDHNALAQVQAAGWTNVVVKPAISASGYRTHAFNVASAQALEYLEDAATYGDFLVQPFFESIRHHGEVSMIFFNGNYSHAVLKKPREGEFRVQAEYGGHEVPFHPSPEIIHTGETILARTGIPFLYARIDGLDDGNQFILMELELIEPDLFIDAHPDARKCFVEAIHSNARQL
jgi:glutathione synthase/RimK-type ligase-like ATP-grasp enzyme